jgi:endonuclease/exonuclease/phosphatase (EEP) superfamily protein YafD
MDRGHRGWRAAELIGWGVVAGVGLVMITQAFGWDGTRIVSTLQSLTPYGIPLVVFVAAGAIWARRYALAATSAAVGLGALLLATPMVFPPGRPDTRPDAAGLSAAAVNLLYSNPQVDAVADDLIGLDADVIAFSEYTPEHRSTLVAHPVANRYPYKINRDSMFADGMALWSKYALTENEQIDTVNGSIDASLEGPDGTIRVFAVHPPTPIFDHDDWKRELRAVAEFADDVVTPTLVIGDFNAAYWHPAFRDILRQGLTDAHMANGQGWSTSWPTDELFPPFVRLDHALTGNGLVSTDIDDFRLPGSDHAAFVVTVKPVAS